MPNAGNAAWIRPPHTSSSKPARAPLQLVRARTAGQATGPILQESGSIATRPVPIAMSDAPESVELEVGARVRLLQAPTYLKSADAMPMLRPPDLVDAGEEGEVVGLRAGEQVAVRFRRGAFLLERRQLERLLS